MRSLCTQHSTSTSGSNRRIPPPRGSSSQASLGHPLLLPLAVRPLFSLRRILTPRCAACGSIFPVVPLSLLLVLRLPSCARLCARCTCTGADGCAFPSATAGVFQYRIAYVFALTRLFRGAFVYWVGRTCFPGRDWRTTSNPLLHSSILLMSTSSSRASMVWSATVFGVARAVAHFEARTWFSLCRRTGSCCHAFTR